MVQLRTSQQLQLGGVIGILVFMMVFLKSTTRAPTWLGVISMGLVGVGLYLDALNEVTPSGPTYGDIVSGRVKIKSR